MFRYLSIDIVSSTGTSPFCFRSDMKITNEMSLAIGFFANQWGASLSGALPSLLHAESAGTIGSAARRQWRRHQRSKKLKSSEDVKKIEEHQLKQARDVVNRYEELYPAELRKK